MKRALILLALAACEHADKAPPRPAPPPAPAKLDPVQQARAEFEVVSPDLAAGTSKVYARGDFMASASIEDQFDEGDFLGRMITLFGPRDDHAWVLRHKKTGLIVTAYAGTSGPAYGAALRLDDPAVEKRKAADPLLAKNPADPTQPLDWSAMKTYSKHLGDAEAGPELAGVVARLDALVSQVRPADWEKTEFYDEEPGVYRIGAKGGESFNDALPPHDALAFLLRNADAKDAGVSAYEAVLLFYSAHKDELAPERPRVLASYRRFVAAANKAEPEIRDALLDEARALKP